jgi:hypothetical protein
MEVWMSDKNIPVLPIIDLMEMEMRTSDEVKHLIGKTREFLYAVHKELTTTYDEGNHLVVAERLGMLANLLPSSSMAKAIAIKAYYKRKVEIMAEYINDPEKKKLGTTFIKDTAKDHCYSEFALMTLADETHTDIREQIGALRSILSTHKAEIEARIGGNQT